MHYLAIHDFLWINNVVTGARLPYDPAALEKAMAAQYAYGRSNDPLKQAAFLLKTMLGSPPFAAGNIGTAFLVVMTFLVANGCKPVVAGAEAAVPILQCARGEITASEAIGKLAVPGGEGLQPGDTLRKLVSRLCHDYAEALAHLAEQEVSAAA